MRTIATIAFVVGIATVVAAQDAALDAVPPVVVKATPQAGDDDVDPKLGEIKVTFSKEMNTTSWSWGIYSKGSFPKVNGKAKFLDDKRTAVLPVQLEPGRTYALWINTSKLVDFKDTDGRAALPYLLVFRTKK